MTATYTVDNVRCELVGRSEDAFYQHLSHLTNKGSPLVKAYLVIPNTHYWMNSTDHYLRLDTSKR